MKKAKILIVRSLFNDTTGLYKSATEALEDNKVKFKYIFVKGAFEIPVTIARNIKKFNGVIALGIIIKGETPNFNLISQSITNGLIELSILYKKPIGNAVLTCFNKEQAKQRDHKGKEAVEAVLDVISQKWPAKY